MLKCNIFQTAHTSTTHHYPPPLDGAETAAGAPRRRQVVANELRSHGPVFSLKNILTGAKAVLSNFILSPFYYVMIIYLCKLK